MTMEHKYDTHEKRRDIAAERWPGDKNVLNNHRHVTLTKMNLRNGYAMALKDHALPMEATIEALRAEVEALRKVGHDMQSELRANDAGNGSSDHERNRMYKAWDALCPEPNID